MSARLAAQLADGCVPVPMDPVRRHAQSRGDLCVIDAPALLLHDRAAPAAGVAQGATVIGTASAANHEYLRSLGATPLLTATAW